MLFRNRATILIHLTDRSLKIASPAKNFDQTLSFPEDLIEYGGITDEDKFKKILGEFLKESGIKGNAAILLSEKLVSKEILKIGENNKEDMEKFFHNIPLKSDSTGRLIIQKTDKFELFATNRSLIDIVKTIAKLNNITILSVTPVTAFEEDYSTKKLSTADVEDILKESQTLNIYDFLKNSSSEEAIKNQKGFTENKPKSNSFLKYIIFFTIICITVGAVAFSLFASGILNDPFSRGGIQKDVLPTAAPTASPTPTPTPLPDKNSIKIRVLNGSGIAGQAKEASDAIAELGYGDITIGNAPDATASATNILYKNSVPKTFIGDIDSALKKLYSSVASAEANQQDFDVIIITGNE